ncbi:MAG: M14 family zinc carboxypeptidase [bacterium]
MKRSLFVLLLVLTVSALCSEELLRISKNDFLSIQNKFKELDIAGRYRNDYIDIVADESQKQMLDAMLVKYSVVVRPETKAVYPTLMQVNDSIDKLHLLYSSLTDLETLGFTVNGNPIKMLKINGVNPVFDMVSDEFLLMANHHSREWQTVTTALFFADSILKSYSSNAAIKSLVDSTFIIVIPTVNPDGYNYSRTSDEWWRKNRSLRGGFYGADINRNYGGSCDGKRDGEWGNIYNSSTSHYPATDIYCGPYPNSEREVQFIQQLLKDYDFDISISLHSYSELVLWPYGSSADTVLDNQLISSLGTKIAAKILKQNGTGYYTPEKADALYPTTGDSDDWIYGYTKYVKGITTLPFTFEVDTGFSPPEANLDKLHRRVFAGILYSAFYCDSLDGKLKEVPLKPTIAFSTDNKMEWTETNSGEQYQSIVRRYEGETDVRDTANTISMYNMSNFVVVSGQSHTIPNSFMASNIVFSYSICEPYYSGKVEDGDSFKCYVWYDLEDSFDMALFEISEDGMEYKALDTLGGVFNESSFGWRYYSKSLSEFAGKEVFIRTRVMFDDGTFGPGFYIDDIYPVVSFTKDSLYATVNLDTFIQLSESDSSFYFSVQPTHFERGPLIKSGRIRFNYLLGLLNQDFPLNIKHQTKESAVITSNVTGKIFKIKILTEKNNLIEAKLFNANGSIVKKFKLKGNILNEIDLSDVKSGEYFLDLLGIPSETKKVIILK